MTTVEPGCNPDCLTANSPRPLITNLPDGSLRISVPLADARSIVRPADSTRRPDAERVVCNVPEPPVVGVITVSPGFGVSGEPPPWAVVVVMRDPTEVDVVDETADVVEVADIAADVVVVEPDNTVVIVGVSDSVVDVVEVDLGNVVPVEDGRPVSFSVVVDVVVVDVVVDRPGRVMRIVAVVVVELEVVVVDDVVVVVAVRGSVVEVVVVVVVVDVVPPSPPPPPPPPDGAAVTFTSK